ncbi:hypothetical protein HMN09_00010600 [Mycena chlorophos]|uniref:F-box domain-containing protein n=1 Tax=Mycena chlorophos TaxID=658473 RepID=A0A8H6WRX8_MYCCL|nr:hypothetical protein HMN09_00010600 [Mycena chlorophos]
MRTHTAILALPHEIISQIFIQCLPPYPLCAPLTGRDSALALVSICGRLRKIGLAEPLLWRAFQITSIPDDNAEDPTWVNRVNDWLNRSGATPLSIRLAFAPEHLDEAIFVELLSAIIARRERWEYLHLVVDTTAISRLSGPAPLLREAEITVSEESTWDVYLLQRAVAQKIRFSDAPQMRKVRFWDVGCTVDSLPWAQLTALTLRHMSLGQCLPLLAHTSSLAVCSLELVDEDPPTPVVVRIESLHAFILRRDDSFDAEMHWGSSVTDYLSYFDLPAIKRLQIPMTFLSGDPPRGLERFAKLSGCRLQALLIVRGSDEYTEDDFRSAVAASGRITIRDEDEPEMDWPV